VKVGFAERDITPDRPGDRPEGVGYNRMDTVHDPCKVRAVVVDDGRARVALVGCDLESLFRSVVQDARREIEAACGIPKANVLVSASHSHGAGFASIVEPGLFDHASDYVRHLAYDLSSCPSPDYVARVREQIVAVVVAADAARVDAVCCVGSGTEGSVTFNRRFRMKNGRTWTHPGKGNPDILGPAGSVDPEVGVVGAWDLAGRFLGCVVNFACHGTTRPGGISADWVYYLEQTVCGVMGEDATMVFLNGACGDVTQIDNLGDRAIELGEAAARRVGQCVGAEALKALAKAEPGDLASVAAHREVLSVDRLKPSAEHVRKSLAMCQKEMTTESYVEWNFAKKTLLLDALIEKYPCADVEAQAIQIGPAVFLGNPAEMFTTHGLEIKERSPFPFTYVVELANGCVGYTPPREAFGPGGGGLETRLSEYRNLEPTAGRQIVEASLRLARSLKPGAVPEPEKAPPFSGPFASGTAPPQLE